MDAVTKLKRISDDQGSWCGRSGRTSRHHGRADFTSSVPSSRSACRPGLRYWSAFGVAHGHMSRVGAQLEQVSDQPALSSSEDCALRSASQSTVITRCGSTWICARTSPTGSRPFFVADLVDVPLKADLLSEHPLFDCRPATSSSCEHKWSYRLSSSLASMARL